MELRQAWRTPDIGLEDGGAKSPFEARRGGGFTPMQRADPHAVRFAPRQRCFLTD